MQTTVYFREEDVYLLRLLQKEAKRRRTSVSSLIVAILEQHFEKGKDLGEILIDFGVLTPAKLDQLREEAQKRSVSVEDVLKEQIPEEIIEQAKLVLSRVGQTD